LIDAINADFYNQESFDKIPFDTLITDLLAKYELGNRILEIGSGGGALAYHLSLMGKRVDCIEPAKSQADKARGKGLQVFQTTIQAFTPQEYNTIIALSSLIHVPKKDLPVCIKKIAKMLIEPGYLFVSMIEGEGDGLEDPTNVGKPRYFAKYSESELDTLFSSHFTLLESIKRPVTRMGFKFLIQIYKKILSIN